jgi:hypothetical protein
MDCLISNGVIDKSKAASYSCNVDGVDKTTGTGFSSNKCKSCNHKIFLYKKGYMKLNMAVNMYLHINTCLVNVEACENKT